MPNNSPALTTESNHQPDDELDLLDLVLTFVENWKLLILGPIVTGLVALGISFALPKTYRSESSVQVERAGSGFSAPVAASLAMSADVLRTIAPVAGIDGGLTAEEIHKKLSKRIQVTIGKQDKLLNVTTEAHTPETAKNLNQALLDTLFPYSKPRGLERKQLQQQQESERARLQETTKLEQETGGNIASGKSISEATASLYGELLAANSARQRTVLDIERRLEGLDSDDVVQAPTLPGSAIKPKKPLIALGVTVATGFLLLLFVFARQALRSAQESSSDQAAKIARIRKALPW